MSGLFLFEIGFNPPERDENAPLIVDNPGTLGPGSFELEFLKRAYRLKDGIGMADKGDRLRLFSYYLAHQKLAGNAFRIFGARRFETKTAELAIDHALHVVHAGKILRS